ncbi:glycoside hydrolase family 35 protein [Actinoplanes derwentensis]|uniref:Beta-galactosidase n=1 Tax=Actinoplanes derwentensis TaxID=113562 RepID=A0A1H2DEA3_9ACTN|nr:glycoside hydrolase family 35 protein [Actinoplanes derwentensis]GID84809.1 beta-galactosidase [Actinoplanes derwentensis]SDT81041.1 beta-galactosidase [Actinoplanes derwentensis]
MIELSAPETTALTWSGRRLYRRGAEHQILSGALHYFRVHPRLWRDRIRRLADLGLNTVDTYVPWNFHQPRSDRAPDFEGWRDLAGFLEMIGAEGLDAIVRPGPYICAEWSNGGLPSWLTGRDVALRSSDPGFTTPVGRWFDMLIPRLAVLQAGNGGPIVAVQVENEFGSYGDDHAYLRWNRDALTDRGITELLFTADGPTELMLDGGTLPGTLAAATLGSKPEAARALLAARRDGEPFIVAEFWNGWFDHWGERHHVRGVDSALGTLRGIVADGGSVSIYMAHGGTNFGLWAGANETGGVLQPTITSYDSDAPIAEDGTLTPKFWAMREVLGARGELRVPPRSPTLAPRTVTLRQTSGLLAALRHGTAQVSSSTRPASFEKMGLDAGFALHTAHPRVPAGDHTVTLADVRDIALVFADGHLLGTVGPGTGTVPIRGTGTPVRLEILVESLGRVNYGPGVGAHKGLLGPVLLDRRIVQNWVNAPIPVPEWTAADLSSMTTAGSVEDSGPGFWTGDLDVPEPADTFLALPGSGRGLIWINDFLLGRYWKIGPQVTLYCPAPLLRPGANTVTVLELDQPGGVLELRARPELGPTEEYIEEFD